MTITEIKLTLDNGETVSGMFSEYGWQQWGAPERTLYQTMQFWTALIDQAQEDDELSVLLGIREKEDE